MGLKLIIAGSRDLADPALLEEAFQKLSEDCEWPEIVEVVSGGARGVDALGESWAAERGIPVKLFPADWEVHGRAAGPIRNAQMAQYADALLAVWDGESRGTHDMIKRAQKRGLLVYVYSPMCDTRPE